MNRLLNKTRFHLSADRPLDPRSSSGPGPPTTLDIIRYRQQQGVNLGSIFVLEQWLYPSMFEPTAKGGSELDAVTASVAAHGIDATRHRWEQHWASALSDAEIQFLAHKAHITAVRIPLGYFTLGPRFCISTPFEPYSSIYTNAWQAVLTLSERLARIGGISVFLDLHALPGGANDQDHSGTSSHKAALWGNKRFLQRAKDCALFLAQEVAAARVKQCVGVQLCNEATWGAGAKGMYSWAEDVLKAMGKIDSSIPVYVSDAWNLGEALSWGSKMNRVSSGRNPVGAASSKYYCFSDDDKSKSPQQIIEQVRNSEFGEVAPYEGEVLAKGAVQVFATEWSCVFDPASKAKAPGNEISGLISQFGEAQVETYAHRSGGAFFWTAKMDWMDGGEWGLFAMTKQGDVVAPKHLSTSFSDVKDKVKRAEATKDHLKAAALKSHTDYWNQQSPQTHFEHWRFGIGYDLGFADAKSFYEARSKGIVQGTTAGADIIGSVELWVLKRLTDSGAAQMGNFAWEFEHGFRQGIAGFGTISPASNK